MFTVGAPRCELPGVPRGAPGRLWGDPQPSLSPLCWQGLGHGTGRGVAVGPSPVEALKGSCSKPRANAALTSA